MQIDSIKRCFIKDVGASAEIGIALATHQPSVDASTSIALCRPVWSDKADSAIKTTEAQFPTRMKAAASHVDSLDSRTIETVQPLLQAEAITRASKVTTIAVKLFESRQSDMSEILNPKRETLDPKPETNPNYPTPEVQKGHSLGVNGLDEIPIYF